MCSTAFHNGVDDSKELWLPLKDTPEITLLFFVHHCCKTHYLACLHPPQRPDKVFRAVNMQVTHKPRVLLASLNGVSHNNS